MSLKEFSLTIFSFFCLLIVLLFFFPKSPAGGESWDNIPTALTPITLIREGNLDFNEFVEGKQKLSKSQADPDEIYYFSLTSDRRVVANFPIINGVLLTPFYSVLSIVNPQLLYIDTFNTQLLLNIDFFISVLLTVITCFFLYLLIKKRTRSIPLASLGVFIFVFCSPVIGVSSRFVWQHTFSLLFITATLLCATKKQSVPVILFSLLTTLSRPPAFFIVFPFLIAALIDVYQQRKEILQKRDPAIICTMAAIVIILFFQLWYSHFYLGSILLLAPQYVSSRFTGNYIYGILGLLFSPSKGLFIFSPIFFFSVFWLFKKIHTGQEYYMYALAIGLFISLIAKWDMWYGGWSLSYRMLSEIVPMLVIITTDFLSTVKLKSIAGLLVVLTICISFLFNTQITANRGDCGFHGSPIDIDSLTEDERLIRLWLDSPLKRCILYSE